MLLAEWDAGDALLSMIYFFFLFMFIWLFIVVVADLFRDHTLSGGWKAVWVIALIVFPLISVLVYLIVRGPGMNERSAKAAEAAQKQMDSYIRETAGAPSTADELKKLADLKASGAISDADFEAAKAKILS